MEQPASDIEEHVSLDLHHLSATYKVPAETGEALTAQARDATQLLVAGLFALPVEKTNEGPVITLPAATTALPREKPVPQPRAFARAPPGLPPSRGLTLVCKHVL